MTPIDDIMEAASRALERTDYLESERLCLQALAMAHEQRDFDTYARILLPLQECRRQRRQLAADAGVFVLAGDKLSPVQILERHPVGCLMLVDPPYTAADEKAVRDLARARGLMIEVLHFDGVALRQAFEQRMENIGDAALADLPDDLPLEQRVEALAALLDRVGDHEFAHQRLAEAARKLAKQ